MPKEFGRDQRVADFVQRELAQILQFEMKDPRVGLVSVNAVRVSPDLGYADAYVSAIEARDEDARAELLEVLNGAAGWFRTLLAKRSQMRTTPRLRFHWDEVTERGSALSRLIDEAVAADRARAAASGDAADHYEADRDEPGKED